MCDWGGCASNRKVLAYVLCNGPIIRSAGEVFFFSSVDTCVSIQEMRSRVTLFRSKKANDWAAAAAALNNFPCDLLHSPVWYRLGRKLTGWNIRRQSRTLQRLKESTRDRVPRHAPRICLLEFHIPAPTFTCDLLKVLVITCYTWR